MPDRRAAPTAPADGPYPNWPQRGDLTDEGEIDAAIAAWAQTLKGVTLRRPPRVLYAATGSRPFVLLHGVGQIGGERLVLVIRDKAGWQVRSDNPAPLRGTTALSVRVLPYPEPDAPPGCTPEESTPLLVLADPGVSRARWRTQVPDWAGCVMPPPLPWQDVALPDGSALVTVPPPHSYFWFDVDLGDQPVQRLYGTDLSRDYGTTGSDPQPDPWRARRDGSNAYDLFESAQDDGLVGGRARPMWLAGLPDGMPAVLLVTEGDPRVVLIVRTAAGTTETVLDVPRDPMPPAYAVVVDGYDGRWLLVVGRDDLPEAALVDGDERVAVPLDHGWGAIQLDADPGPDARVWTSDHGPDGGVEIVRAS